MFKFVPGFDAKMKRAAMGALRRGAHRMAKQLRSNISDPAPPSSSRGEYPKRRTGDLLRSVQVVDASDQYSVLIKITADHAMSVEHKRPFATRTFKESGEAVLRSIQRDGVRF